MNERKQWVMDTVLTNIKAYQSLRRRGRPKHVLVRQKPFALLCFTKENVFYQAVRNSGNPATERCNCMKITPYSYCHAATTGLALGIGGTTILTGYQDSAWRGSCKGTTSLPTRYLPLVSTATKES